MKNDRLAVTLARALARARDGNALAVTHQPFLLHGCGRLRFSMPRFASVFLAVELFLAVHSGASQLVFRAINLLLGVIAGDRCVESSLT